MSSALSPNNRHFLQYLFRLALASHSGRRAPIGNWPLTYQACPAWARGEWPAAMQADLKKMEK